ncbi:hypothetical protein [Amycolatopsis anabasis]|uniref:hypothetical protein n=1 Tax=Amycolatopsis anabasis TaxID=1840409 RepID=UPI00131C52AF|nr:hypothetical protein [Amycolatopsis anabasis]
MQIPVPDLAAIRAIDDPVRRREAARAMAQAVTAQCRTIELDAEKELIKRHGSVSAAARELGFSPTALLKRHPGADRDTAPAGNGAAQAIPALRFATPEEAEAALQDWQLERADLDDERDQLLLGALAAGIDPVRIYELTGVPVDTITRLRPAGNITVSALADSDLDLLDDFARALHNHARARMDHATTQAERTAARIWQMVARSVIVNCAPGALVDPLPAEAYRDEETFVAAMTQSAQNKTDNETSDPTPDRVAMQGGPDAWLAKQSIQFRRIAQLPAASGKDLDTHPAISAAFTAIADAIAHLRRTGTLPTLQ